MKAGINIHRISGTVCLAILVILAFRPCGLYAQPYRAIQSEIIIKGTSNVQPWELVSPKAACIAEFGFKENRLTSVRSLVFSVAVKDLKGPSELMNKRAHKALKAYPYDAITYTGKFSKITAQGRSKYLINSEGNLRIAGKTQVVSIQVTAIVNADGTITCRGTKNIKMSDYNVKPPRVLIENMEIGNVVAVSFNLLFFNTSKEAKATDTLNNE